MPSYLQYSQHLLQDALKPNFSNYNIKDISLISADFESLYTNIILPHALDTITEFVSKKFHSKHINIFAFHALLKIVLFNNYFKYKDCIYLQEIGIGMGLICGPSVANIYVFILEDKALCIHRPIYYKRYIDDIFKIIITNFSNLISVSSDLIPTKPEEKNKENNNNELVLDGSFVSFRRKKVRL